MVKMDGSGRTSKRNHKFLRPIKPYRHALLPTQPQHSPSSSSHITNHSNTGPTADQAGRPSSTAAQQEVAADKSSTGQLPDTDTWSEEVSMTDAEFDDGLTQAVYNVLNDEITDKQPEAALKFPSIQLSEPDSAVRSTKRVKFSTKRLIEQL